MILAIDSGKLNRKACNVGVDDMFQEGLKDLANITYFGQEVRMRYIQFVPFGLCISCLAVPCLRDSMYFSLVFMCVSPREEYCRSLARVTSGMHEPESWIRYQLLRVFRLDNETKIRRSERRGLEPRGLGEEEPCDGGDPYVYNPSQRGDSKRPQLQMQVMEKSNRGEE